MTGINRNPEIFQIDIERQIMGVNVFKIESTNKAIASSMFFSLLAKALNFIQMLVISYAFGLQRSTDILFYMLSTVLLLTYFVTAVNSQVIIPEAIRIRNTVSEDKSKEFILHIYYIYLFIGIIGTLILLACPAKLMALFSKFGIDDIQANVNILMYIIPNFLLIIINTYCSSVLNSYRLFSLPMILDMVKNLVIILFILLFSNLIEVSSLAIGTLAGNLIQFFIINALMVKILNCRIKYKGYKISRDVMKKSIYGVAGQLVTFINGFVLIYLLSGFSAGVFTAVDNSQKIVTVLGYVLIGQVSSVIGVNFVELYNQNNFSMIRETFEKYLKIGLLFMIPLCFIIFLNSEAIISLIFQRGKFDSNAVKITSEFLRYLILMMPAMLINNFVYKLMFAKQIQETAFWYLFAYNLISLLIIGILITISGYYGYAAGLSACYTLYTVILLYFVSKTYFKYINPLNVLRFFTVNAFLNSVLSIIVWHTSIGMNHVHGDINKLVLLIINTGIYMVLFLILSCFIEENKNILVNSLEFLRRKIRKHAVG